MCFLRDETRSYLLWSRLDERFIRLHGKHKAFHKGGNSSCRLHIRQHYKLYKEKCEKEDIPMNHWAIPRDIWKAMEEKKASEKQGKEKEQQILTFETVTGPREFTRLNVLEAVAKLIASNDQVCQCRCHHHRSNIYHTYSPCTRQ